MIKTFTNEQINNAHAYLVINEEQKTALLIDTALKTEEIIKYLKDNSLDLQEIILTHGHYDHVTNLDKVICAFPLVKVWIHKRDLMSLYSSFKNLSSLRHRPWKMKYNPNVKTFTKPISCKMAEFNVNLKPSPGHTPGSIFVEIPKEKAVFIGDTLFIKDDQQFYGRHHWYQWQTNAFKFKRTIKNLFDNYSDDWLIYPGHWDYGFKLETIKDDLKNK